VSILSDFEDRMAAAVEGLFSGAFRSPVQPAEIAKALGRRMDKGRSVGVEKVYVPNRYTVVLSSRDEERFGGFLDTLAGELSTYLVAYARENDYAIPGTPVVRFSVDPRLRLGQFDTEAELASAEESYAVPDVQAPAGAVPAAPGAAPDEADVSSRRRASGVHALATVTVSGLLHDVALKGERVVVGRLADCGVCLDDANVSREHAAFEAEGAGWAVVDLGSTNGTFVNGEPVQRLRLRDGDTVQIGATRLVFHEPRR
jgi:hypothetical protein